MDPLTDAAFRALVAAPAAFRRRDERAVLRLRGGDRLRFLNGMVTNELADVPAGRAVYALQLDRKGHPLGDLWVLIFESELWLDIDADRGEAVRETLDKHLIADDVQIDVPMPELCAVDFEGPSAAAALPAELPAAGHCRLEQADGAPAAWLGGVGLTSQSVRLIGPRAFVDAWIARCGYPELDPAAAEALRIRAFQPRYGSELGARSFPAEARLESRAISFSKGCYIGQEIVARIEARGAVNRLLVPLELEVPASVGDAIEADGKKVGEVTSATAVGDPLALGYVKVAHAEVGTELQVGGRRAVVGALPTERPA